MAKSRKPESSEPSGKPFKKTPFRKPVKATSKLEGGFKLQHQSSPAGEVTWPMRLNKYVAHCGVCSRRDAAELVKKGEIYVNGQKVTEPFVLVNEADKVTYLGKPIRPESRRVYLLLNKPKGVITTVEDERGRRTVLDLVKPKVRERIFPVGRLDRDTTGLLLLTNDGDLAKKLSHPSHKVAKVYYAVLDRPFTRDDMAKVKAGLELEDGIAEVDDIQFINGEDSGEVALELHSGRNRIVRRIFEQLGYQIQKLDRVYYGGLTKKDLPRGKFRYLTDREVIMLRHFT